MPVICGLSRDRRAASAGRDVESSRAHASVVWMVVRITDKRGPIPRYARGRAAWMYRFMRALPDQRFCATGAGRSWGNGLPSVTPIPAIT
jgi:hypothetical protein